jgi:predicted nucleic acid-binding protein
MRVLLDTNILARAAAGSGLANEILLTATRFEHRLVLSAFLVNELRRVLRYPRLQSVHGLSEEEMEKYVSDLVAVGEMVVAAMSPAVVAADPTTIRSWRLRLRAAPMCSAHWIDIFTASPSYPCSLPREWPCATTLGLCGDSE